MTKKRQNPNVQLKLRALPIAHMPQMHGIDTYSMSGCHKSHTWSYAPHPWFYVHTVSRKYNFLLYFFPQVERKSQKFNLNLIGNMPINIDPSTHKYSFMTWQIKRKTISWCIRGLTPPQLCS